MPVLAFAALDVYYLKLERKFRFLFDQVRLDEHDIDFSMRLTKDPLEISKQKLEHGIVLSWPVFICFIH